VVGDGRAYNVALLVLDPDYSVSVSDHERVVAEAVEAANSTLSRPEQVKQWTVLEGDWLPGGDELTPTMKLKRRPILSKYSEQIQGMYG
jgi:long-subunit acyl-CoA synthetase (AMP-forming)